MEVSALFVLFHRCSTVIELLEKQTEVTALVLLPADREPPVHFGAGENGTLSRQFSKLADLNRRLAEALAAQAANGSLADAGREYLGRFRLWEARFQQLLKRLSPQGRRDGAEDYAQYIRLDELLTLQTGVKADWAPEGEMPTALLVADFPSADELMFIIVHQAFELWFKAMLHELDAARLSLMRRPAAIETAAAHLHRLIHLQRLLVQQIQVPATMQPLDFLQFRSETRTVNGRKLSRGLSPASGTESYQFREIEIAAGLRGNEEYRRFLEGSPGLHIRFMTPRLQERLAELSLRELFDQVVEERGIRDLLEIFTPAAVPNSHADLARLAELMLQFDKYFQFWRFEHLLMVHSMIGAKVGTGFLGPGYLRETAGLGLQAGQERIFAGPQTRPRFFPKLWEVRTRMGSYD
jgi:tryptophan 2,3-dioxygenase